MKRLFFFVLCLSILTACGPSPAFIAGQTAEAETEIAALWTPTPSNTPTPIPTSTPTRTPTSSLTPTHTPTAMPATPLPVPLSKEEVVELENAIMADIDLRGVGNRLVISDPILAGENMDLAIGGLTFGEGADGTTNLSTEFPGDVLPIPNMYSQNVWRFRGRVSLDLQDEAGEIYTFVFVGEGDDLNLLTFGRFPASGFVYLRGVGKVILPSGEEVLVGMTE
jgi:hypothetical protein